MAITDVCNNCAHCGLINHGFIGRMHVCNQHFGKELHEAAFACKGKNFQPKGDQTRLTYAGCTEPDPELVAFEKGLI